MYQSTHEYIQSNSLQCGANRILAAFPRAKLNGIKVFFNVNSVKSACSISFLNILDLSNKEGHRLKDFRPACV